MRTGTRGRSLAAGFLRVSGASDALELTGVHPESYGVAREALARLLVAGADNSHQQPHGSVGGGSGGGGGGGGGGVFIDGDDDDVIFVGSSSGGKKRKREHDGLEKEVGGGLEGETGGEPKARAKKGKGRETAEAKRSLAGSVTLEYLALAQPQIERLIGKQEAKRSIVESDGGGDGSGDAVALSCLASDLGVGTLTLRGVLAALAAPGADDRATADPVSLLSITAVSAADLKPGDVLEVGGRAGGSGLGARDGGWRIGRSGSGGSWLLGD